MSVNKTTIEICVSCAWFQKRLNWMLSSLLQQKGNVPNIIFNVAYPKNNGNPTTENVCHFFKDKGLNIKEIVYEKEIDMQRRGIVRNKQLAETDADFILFADTDMCYDTWFFDDLRNQLENTNLKNEKKCIAASRISLDKKYSKDFFNKIDKNIYPCVIENVAEIVSKWPIYKITNSGAGYFHLANIKNLKENYGGIYVKESRCKDSPSVEKYQKARSDSQFRHMLGGKFTIKTKPQYHLNHERDKEEGRVHITLQR